MNRRSSSISSSDAAARADAGGGVAVLVWILVWLVIFDVLINILFSYPADPKVVTASRLQLYFDYGRSTEAKLARMTRDDPAQSAPITLAGWYDPLVVHERPKQADAPVISIYGMSHAVRLGDALERTSDRFTVRTVGAPGATANWAYGAYLRDRGAGRSRVAILALMSTNLAMITSMSPMTWNVSFPMPYTAARFFITGGSLTAVRPPYTSFGQYVETFRDPEKWAAARTSIAEHDPVYSSFVMQSSLLDKSSLFRLLRRAYAQKLERNVRRKVIDQAGFNADSEQVKVANAIVEEFAARARADGVLPMIFLVNNLGYSDSLFQALRPTLERAKIAYLSSHEFASPNDPRGYLPDSHFINAIDDQMARRLVILIQNASVSPFVQHVTD